MTARAAGIERLRTLIRNTLRPLIPPGAPVALLDFPAYSNPGDSAIWLGERAVLDELGARVVLTADRRTYSRDELARRLERGIILLSGGGNLGDLWPRHQEFREQVIRECSGHRIIQLPQSVHFDDPRALDRARRVFDAHPSLLLLVRDEHSQTTATGAFACTVLLCPDMAFMLGPLDSPVSPSRDLLWLLRRDHEASPGRSAVANAVDWTDEPRRPGLWLGDRVRRLRRRGPRLARAVRPVSAWMDERAARQRLRRALRTLGRARAVITDRLHGHILALLLGVPHVLLRDAHGKLDSFYRTWTSDFEDVRQAETTEEAAALARAMLGKDAGAGHG